MAPPSAQEIFKWLPTIEYSHIDGNCAPYALHAYPTKDAAGNSVLADNHAGMTFTDTVTGAQIPLDGIPYPDIISSGRCLSQSIIVKKQQNYWGIAFKGTWGRGPDIETRQNYGNIYTGLEAMDAQGVVSPAPDATVTFTPWHMSLGLDLYARYAFGQWASLTGGITGEMYAGLMQNSAGNVVGADSHLFLLNGEYMDPSVSFTPVPERRPGLNAKTMWDNLSGGALFLTLGVHGFGDSVSAELAYNVVGYNVLGAPADSDEWRFGLNLKPVTFGYITPQVRAEWRGKSEQSFELHPDAGTTFSYTKPPATEMRFVVGASFNDRGGLLNFIFNLFGKDWLSVGSRSVERAVDWMVGLFKK